MVVGYEQIPTGRGFDEHYGIYMGGGDHWTHVLNLGADNLIIMANSSEL